MLFGSLFLFFCRGDQRALSLDEQFTEQIDIFCSLECASEVNLHALHQNIEHLGGFFVAQNFIFKDGFIDRRVYKTITFDGKCFCNQTGLFGIGKHQRDTEQSCAACNR